jgi:hypothetical protein
LNLRPLRPEGVLVRGEQGWSSGEAVRIRPPVSADLGSRRYSVGYSVWHPRAPAPFGAVGAGCGPTQEEHSQPSSYLADAGERRIPTLPTRTLSRFADRHLIHTQVSVPAECRVHATPAERRRASGNETTDETVSHHTSNCGVAERARCRVGQCGNSGCSFGEGHDPFRDRSATGTDAWS